MTTFTLTPLQEKWLKRLEQFPERQLQKSLGIIDFKTKEYRACCLGEALVCILEEEGKSISDIFNKNGILYDFNDRLNQTDSYIDFHYSQLGLISPQGHLNQIAKINGDNYQTLAGMNDGVKDLDGYQLASDLTWPEIAAYIRANPENVFVTPQPSQLPNSLTEPVQGDDGDEQQPDSQGLISTKELTGDSGKTAFAITQSELDALDKHDSDNPDDRYHN